MRYYIDDEEFGRVYVDIRRGMTRITARWKEGNLVLHVPPGIAVDRVLAAIEEMREKLRKIRGKSDLQYKVGDVIDGFRCRVKIVEYHESRTQFFISRSGNEVTISVPAGYDLNTPAAKRIISKYMQKFMGPLAQLILVPYAWELAEILGVKPADIVVGRGLRKLGHCTPKRVVQLSRNVMFLTEELVQLIICHEFAHLTHMNHSVEFHTLCDSYLGGREKELEAKLKKFPWRVEVM